MKTLKNIYRELLGTGRIKISQTKIADYDRDQDVAELLVTSRGEVISSDGFDSGYFTIQYDKAQKALTLKGNARHFTQRIKDTIFGVICDNPEIIEVSVFLLNDDRLKVASDYSSMRGMTHAEKLKHIPLVTASIKKAYDKDYRKFSRRKFRKLLAGPA